MAGSRQAEAPVPAQSLALSCHPVNPSSQQLLVQSMARGLHPWHSLSRDACRLGPLSPPILMITRPGVSSPCLGLPSTGLLVCAAEPPDSRGGRLDGIVPTAQRWKERLGEVCSLKPMW